MKVLQSGRALTNEEIERIKECVEENLGIPKCKEKEFYYMGIEI